VADVEAPGGEKWERLKSGGKQWQATPKNLPRMQLLYIETVIRWEKSKEFVHT